MSEFDGGDAAAAASVFLSDASVQRAASEDSSSEVDGGDAGTAASTFLADSTSNDPVAENDYNPPPESSNTEADDFSSSESDISNASASAAAAAFLDDFGTFLTPSSPLIQSDCNDTAVADAANAFINSTEPMDVDASSNISSSEDDDSNFVNQITFPRNPEGSYTAEYFNFLPDACIE